MTEEQQKAFDAVEKINEELFKRYNKLNDKSVNIDWISKMPIVSVTFAGIYIFISLSIPSIPEIPLYNSADDERVYYSNGDRYETYHEFIKRKFNEIKGEIHFIKL